MQDFRKIDVWQVAHKLTLAVYQATKSFPDSERFGITSQLRRACVLIPTNIAEGCVRRTGAYFARFLFNAIGSASEVEYLLLLSRDLDYLEAGVHTALSSEIQRVKRMLAAFIRTLSAASAPSSSGREPTAESRQPSTIP